MKLRLLFFLVAQAVTVCAQNITVTFQPAALPGGNRLVTEWLEAGLRFTTPTGLVSNGAPMGLFPVDGTPYIQALSGQTPLTITSIAGQPFSLFMVDLAEYSTVVSMARTITFTGTQVGGMMVIAAFTTDGMIGGPGPDFQTFSFPASFTNLTQVTVTPDLYSMDNLVVAVPEPSASAFILFLLIPAIVVVVARRATAGTRLKQAS
jgi:hypothetical protein